MPRSSADSRREPEAYRRCGRARPSTVRSMPRLENRTIIVTGGASGIGRSLCLAFAAEGARVVVGDVRRDQLHVGGTTTEERSGRAAAWLASSRPTCASGEDIDRMVDAALELGDGRLDVIVNNAMVAGAHSKGLLETSEDDWDIIFDVGLRGLFLCCQRAVRQMVTQEPYGEVRGRIINSRPSTAWSARPRTSPTAP